MLVIGPAPTEYVPEDPQVDLARCQRYYQVLGGYDNAPCRFGPLYGLGGSVHAIQRPWPVPMGGAPTTTKNGTWSVLNCGQPLVTGTAQGYGVAVTPTVTGMFDANPNSADDLLIGEWNP